jgi:hypothetical protein
MRVKHGARAAGADDLDMELRFCRWLAQVRPAPRASDELPLGVDFEDLLSRELAFGGAAGRDGQAKRLATEDHAEIAAGAEHPPARVEATANLDQPAPGVAAAINAFVPS